jgi:hypothetical protein
MAKPGTSSAAFAGSAGVHSSKSPKWRRARCLGPPIPAGGVAGEDTRVPCACEGTRVRRVRVPPGESLLSETESYCVTARWGGELEEVKRQSVTTSELDSAGCRGEQAEHERSLERHDTSDRTSSAESAEPSDSGLHQVVGDGMP